MPSPLYNKYFHSLNRTIDPFPMRMPIDTVDKMVRRRNYREFLEFFKAVFGVVREQNLMVFRDGEMQWFSQLFELWFKALERPGLVFENDDTDLFFFNANITNLLAATPFGNGDACIKRIIDQPNNMAKLLLLYTPRSRLQLPIKPLFDANTFLASLWYANMWNWTDTYVSETVQQNYEYFLANVDERMEPFDSNMVVGYFRSTYIDPVRDKLLKRVYTRSIARFIAGARIENNPNPKSIAVVSAYWNGEHAVYRAFAPYVEELSRHYDLTLVNLTAPGRKKANPGFFRHVHDIEASPLKINIGPIARNDFQLAYFPDIGMSQESFYIGNLRIAPIQCMGTGHPVSSCSPVMDYFISGSEVETTDSPEENYDERLVLLPGLSANPLRPRYTVQKPPLPKEFIINLPWTHMKNNYDIAKVLRQIYDKAEKRIYFSIFPGCGMTRNSSYMATIQDFSETLPRSSIVVHPDFDYETYMYKQEGGRFTLHSYPFGGGTTAVDSLWLRKPLVVLRGRHEFNRFPAALLARLGLDELIADSRERWVEICVRLINDDAYLSEITGRVEALDLEERLFTVTDATRLRRACDHLIAHDAELRRDTSRSPIVIG